MKLNLTSWAESLNETHFPKNIFSNNINIEKYKNRLIFDELLLLQLTSLIRKQNWQHTRLAHTFNLDSSQINQFINSLPFKSISDNSILPSPLVVVSLLTPVR